MSIRGATHTRARKLPALLAITAMSVLLAACNAKNPLASAPSAQLAAAEATDGAVAVTRWAEAYDAKSPQDPRVASAMRAR